MGRPKQTEIPQFQQEKINAIERAADKYVEKRDLRIGVQREEIETRDALTRLMHSNADKIDRDDMGTLAYSRGDYKIVVETKEKLKVRIGEEPQDPDEGDLP